jgi:hypothetical protein
MTYSWKVLNKIIIIIIIRRRSLMPYVRDLKQGITTAVASVD